ncbi:hypothetical protein CR513_51943, partial [Mucuna pruriens]
MLPNVVSSALNTDFKDWKEAVEIILDCMDLDLALWVEKPIPTPDNLQEVKFKKCERSNRIVKRKGNIREYIMEMSNLAAKLKSLKLELGEDLIVHLVLILLPTHFRPSKNKKRKSIEDAAKRSSKGKKPKKNEEFTCFFCKKLGHMKNNVLSTPAGGIYFPSPAWTNLREALKTTVYILNRVPTVAVNKTPYELWIGKKPSVKILHILGYPVEARPYRPHERKLDSRTINCYFVGYVECSQGYKFYNPTSRSFFETRNARILEEVEFEKEENIRNVVFEEESILRDRSQDSKPQDTSIAKGDKFSLKQCPNNDLERNEMQKIPYVLVVGCLIYLSDLGMQHWKAVKCVMHYLKRTKGYMLTYRKSEGLEIIGYSNSNFARCQDRKYSMFGYTYMLARGAISWKSVKWTLIAPSTMVVEFVACFETSNHEIWLRNSVTSLRVVDGIERPLKIYFDNNSIVLYSNNNKSSTKSKFIDIKFLVVKERVQNNQIFIEHIGTSFILVDPLTKGLIPKANASGKVMIPNTPNQKYILCSPHQKRKTKVLGGTKEEKALKKNSRVYHTQVEGSATAMGMERRIMHLHVTLSA